MNVRRFFVTSLALSVAAIGFQFCAMEQFSRGVQRRALAVNATQEERTAMKAEASNYLLRGRIVGWIGFVFALASLAFISESARNHEPALRSVTYTLLAFYVMLQFLLV